MTRKEAAEEARQIAVEARVFGLASLAKRALVLAAKLEECSE